MKIIHEFIDWYKLLVESEMDMENDEEKVSLTYKNTLGETILFVELENKGKTMTVETYNEEVALYLRAPWTRLRAI